MCYTGTMQSNNFFSRKTKKNLLKTKHALTYEQEGKFDAGINVKKEEFLKTIKWCTENKIRFEIVIKPGSKDTIALFYVL